MTYNQVTGKLITAYFRDNKIYRNDVDGNVQTIYYMQEDDSPEPVGLVSIQSGAATYYIDNNTVEGITYRNQPVFSIFPMDKIPETHALFLEDFKWEDTAPGASGGFRPDDSPFGACGEECAAATRFSDHAPYRGV